MIYDKHGNKKKPAPSTIYHNYMILKKYFKQVYDIEIKNKCWNVGEKEELHDIISF